MQYVPLPAAKDFTSLVGCRLPTEKEWKTAFRLAIKANPKPDWNLRDSSLQSEIQYLQSINSSADVLADSYSSDLKIAPPPSFVQAERPHPCFFEKEYPAAESTPFQQLGGNVAEYLDDSERISVIGGSKMSSPDNLDQPVDLSKVKGAANARGFSDVGFRLAFADPKAAAPPLAELKAEAGKAAYLGGPETQPRP